MNAIINANVIVPDTNGDFTSKKNCAVVYDERIEKILPMTEFAPCDMNLTDATGRYVMPGFVNIHIHGCAGKDTMDEDDDALVVMRRMQATTGVTSFLPTTMTYDLPRIRRALERIRRAMNTKDSARIIGCHMEGPYISPAQKGAQAEENIKQADYDDIAGFEDVIKIITLAPEELLVGDFVTRCQKTGIVLSIGHTSANYEQTMTAVNERGIKHFTHVYNAMTKFHHRKPGVVGAVFDTDAYCEIIADNIHSHPAAQRLLYKVKGKKRIILITDSMRACGMGDGLSELGGQAVTVRGELATLADGTIAGSVLKMNRAIDIFRQNTGVSLPQIIEMVTRTPATELNLYDKIGSLETGKLADMVIADENLNIFATVVDGETVYQAGARR